jgi:hypothetical protein
MINKLSQPYIIQYPDFGETGTYFFTTTCGINYEVMFGRKKDNPLHITVVFGVVNDEFEGEEYIETNKGEHYKVMSTVVNIVKHYVQQKPHLRLLEFTGVSRPEENEKQHNLRNRFFSRYLTYIFDNNWKCSFDNNRVMVLRN